MGDPRKPRKKWEGPKHPWIKERLERERELMGRYGLRNKKELWKAETLARRFRHRARSLLGLPPEVRREASRVLVESLYRMGLIDNPNVDIDEVLGINAEKVLERRLQTIVYKKGLAKTIYQARQLVVHGHIAIAGRRVTSPGYLVSREEEKLIDYAPGSPFKERAEEAAQA
ncbi:30S ribosomal protein S4P [Aeropyrum pernix K1]|uniref:Small ribosomal subunit protein uS4 n=2 Tax=Aeropyrum pernix TaxID=56636 RepID=RS4_AERPE|nr:30S ribosomal protein S4 [Aeropyrum pernix]Q9YB58.2 RecName: Full=Small ribosomal subunit protein uS4; AltName: Full=30S ribosomal protein S4 [Aeropyrum pernix K1]BAA80740.2 30S ribosomal protein S4P [Aeropyrum pernix K1]GBF08710.1 30S ribosomal protein S4 [Aeropyrum pernix]